MSTGYIGGASAPPLLGWQGVSPRVKFPAAGLDIALATSLLGTVDTVTPALKLTQVDPSDTLMPFVPGILAAKTIGTWRNLKRSGLAFVDLIEVNCLTAPVGVSGASCANLVVAGTVSGSAILPILTAHTVNDFSGNGMVIGADGGAQLGLSPNGPNYFRGVAMSLNPTANVKVRTLAFPLAGANDGNNVIFLAGYTFVAEVLDNNRNVLASSAPVNTPLVPTGGGYTNFPLTTEIQLNQGTPYYLALRLTNVAQFGNQYFNAQSGPNLHGATVGASPGGGGDLYMTAHAVAGAAWNSTAPDPSTLNGAITYDAGSVGVRGLGGLGGVTVAGDVVMSITLTGAPATPGSDVNTRVNIAAG